MYAKVWNYLRGSVLLQCESPAPERVLNLCGVYGIPFWGVTWQTAERFTLYTVVERKRPPEIADSGELSNVVAARDGLVERVEALDGQALVMAGSTVTKGQLLISGVADSRSGGVRFMSGRGRVYARTWYELSVQVPLCVEEKYQTARSVKRAALDLGKQRINLYGRGSMLGAGCDKIVTYRPLTLPFGLRLPVTLAVEQVTRWDTRTVERTAAQAKAEGEAQLLAQLDTMLTEGGTVTGTRFSTARQGEYLLVALAAECREEIGVSVGVEAE